MRLGVAFGLGLFHGLDFAGGLLTAMEGMAGVAIIVAIAAFSCGVEIGYQLVALPLFGVMKIVLSYRSRAVEAGLVYLSPRYADSGLRSALL